MCNKVGMDAVRVRKFYLANMKYYSVRRWLVSASRRCARSVAGVAVFYYCTSDEAVRISQHQPIQAAHNVVLERKSKVVLRMSDVILMVLEIFIFLSENKSWKMIH